MSPRWPTTIIAGIGVVTAVPTARASLAWNFPTPATPLAFDTLQVHNKFMAITLAIFVVVFAIMIYSIFHHRKSRNVEAAQFSGPGSAAQVFWTTVPFVIFAGIDFILMGIPAFHSVQVMQDTRSDADMVVKITGSQWKWQYEYPDQGVRFVSALTTPQAQIANREEKGEHYLLEVDNPLVLPVGKKVRLLLTSTDVIHTWWVPQFGVKRDAIPGFMRETWARIERPGIYRGQCAELCGRGHGFMPVVVRAVSEPEFRAWLTQQKAGQAAQAASADREWSRAELMKHGEEVYGKICVACHQASGMGVPGVFPALAGSKVVNGPMVDSKGLLVKDGHLDRVMNGKPGTAMQAFKNTLSDVDIAAVVSFERNAFGNSMGDLVQPARVKALR